MVRTVDIDHTVEFVARQPIGKRVIVGARRLIGIFGIMMPLERLRRARLPVGILYQPEIAVKPTLGAYHRTRRQGCHYVGEIKLRQKSGDKMTY